MELPSFELHQPTTVEDAVALAADLEKRGQPWDFLAGGTDLLPNYKCRLGNRPHVVSLRAVDALRDISPTRLGALATLSEIEHHPEIQRALPVLTEAARVAASPLLRNSGTLGGNLCLDTRCFYFNQSRFWRRARGGCLKDGTSPACLVTGKEDGACVAAYSGDLAPALMTLGAAVRIAHSGGEREIPLDRFFHDDGVDRNSLQPGEMVTAVLLPPDALRRRAGYRKLRVREAIDFPLLGVAASVLLSGDLIEDLRVCVGAVAPRPLLMDEVTSACRGERFSEELAGHVAAEVRARVQPVRNAFLSVSYRRKMIEVFTRRVLRSLAGAASSPGGERGES